MTTMVHLQGVVGTIGSKLTHSSTNQLCRHVYVTLLRDPLERMFSWFAYCHKYSPNKCNAGADFVKAGDKVKSLGYSETAGGFSHEEMVASIVQYYDHILLGRIVTIQVLRTAPYAISDNDKPKPTRERTAASVSSKPSRIHVSYDRCTTECNAPNLVTSPRPFIPLHS